VSAISFISFPEESHSIIYFFEKGIDTVFAATIYFVAFYYFKELEQVRLIEPQASSATLCE
jgi:energy-converting hydrogenase Eha subunit F